VPTPAKGSYGDVAVIGGEGLYLRGMGMGGAAVLAATAALHHGAGRVMLALLDEGACQLLPQQPELMLRQVSALHWDQGVVVCGCGGGQAVAAVLPQALEQAHRLVLDADALNAIASDSACSTCWPAAPTSACTPSSPHPLKPHACSAADTAAVQTDRPGRDQPSQQTSSNGAQRPGIIASPHQLQCINGSGTASLATAGTGDVLAGMVGAAWAQGLPPHTAAHGPWRHGHLAEQWPPAADGRRTGAPHETAGHCATSHARCRRTSWQQTRPQPPPETSWCALVLPYLPWMLRPPSTGAAPSHSADAAARKIFCSGARTDHRSQGRKRHRCMRPRLPGLNSWGHRLTRCRERTAQPSHRATGKTALRAHQNG
jgi:hypothetical protein